MAKRRMTRQHTSHAEPVRESENTELLRGILGLLKAQSAPQASARHNGATQVAKPAMPEPEESFDDDLEPGNPDPSPLDNDPDLQDRRERSRKVYMLADKATLKLHLMPERPSSCRRIITYLRNYEVGTTKQMAHALKLEKKTIGNGLAELLKVKLVNAVDIPKS